MNLQCRVASVLSQGLAHKLDNQQKQFLPVGLGAVNLVEKHLAGVIPEVLPISLNIDGQPAALVEGPPRKVVE